MTSYLNLLIGDRARGSRPGAGEWHIETLALEVVGRTLPPPKQ